MVFTSHSFVFYFLPLVLGGYYLAPPRWRSLFLVIASYLFYGWWSPWFVLLMLGSTVIDFYCGRAIAAPGANARVRRAALTTSIVANLSLLGFFKYFMFASTSVSQVLGWLGADPFPILEVVLPIGISFYTFQSMSYSIDIFRERARPARSFIDFAAYVSLFPQLIAGPIIRYHEISEQLRKRTHSVHQLSLGFQYFVIGFAKKLLIANNVGVVADVVFAADAPAWHLAWVGVTAYAFQIYFDFSGYSDMAIGLGHMFGFRFPRNFNAPYRSESITDFWRRWHISLSSWLRDYLYVPLGGNRKGARRTYVNLAATMLLGGLWHGAQWTFVVWGAAHGVLLAVERARGKGIFAGLPHPLRVAGTFALVLVTWVLFRAPTIGDATHYLGSMFGLVPAGVGSPLLASIVYSEFPLLILLLAGVLVWRGLRTEELVEWRPAPGSPFPAAREVGLLALFVLGVLELSVQSHNPFLYFQF